MNGHITNVHLWRLIKRTENDQRGIEFRILFLSFLFHLKVYHLQLCLFSHVKRKKIFNYICWNTFQLLISIFSPVKRNETFVYSFNLAFKRDSFYFTNYLFAFSFDRFWLERRSAYGHQTLGAPGSLRSFCLCLSCRWSIPTKRNSIADRAQFGAHRAASTEFAKTITFTFIQILYHSLSFDSV